MPCQHLGGAIVLALMLNVSGADAQAPQRGGQQANMIDDGTFGQQWTSRALAAEAAGRWSDAADAWDVLSLARPDVALHAANARLARDRAKSAAVEATQRGEEALRKYEVRRAMAHFLSALSALPEHEPAQRALRQLARSHPFEEPAGGGSARTRGKPGTSAGASSAPPPHAQTR